MVIEISHLPNAAYLRFGDHFLARLCFPDLYEESMAKDPSARRVPTSILQEIFQMFTSCIIAEQPVEQAHLTPNYDTESSRQAKMGSGPPGQGTHAIAASRLASLTKEVLLLLRRQPYGKNAFWLIEGRGMRAATVSKLEDLPRTPEEIFSNLFKLQTLAYMIDWKEWFFDIASELMLDKHVLMFRRDSFPLLMQKVLDLPEADSHAIVHTAKFAWDSAALLNDAGGFRFAPARQDRDRCGVHYVQGYSTEKHPIYFLTKDSNAASLNFPHMLHNGANTYASHLLKSWADIALQYASWNARLEIRVRGDRLSLSDRLDFSTEQMERYLFMFDTRAWFQFKSIRLFALSNLLTSWYQCTDAQTKAHPDSLQLMFACLWSVNALNSRPADMATDRALSAVVAPHRLNRADGCWNPVPDHYGVHFLAGLNYNLNRHHGVGYLMGATLPLEALQPLAANVVVLKNLVQYLSKRRSSGEDDLDAGISKRRTVTQTNKTTPQELFEPPADFVNPFTLDKQGYTLKSDDGSLDERLGKVYCQFQFDVVFKLPVRSSNAGLTYERSNRDRMTQDHWHQALHRVNSADIFQLVAFNPNSTKLEWQRVYDQFFPETPTKPGKSTQNWGDFVYLPEWRRLCADVDKEAWKAVRTEMLRVWYKELAWVPCAKGGRAWTTKKGDMRGNITEHSDDMKYNGPCPIIVLNPTRTPKSNFAPRLVQPVERW
jgi:hypothetical protein